MSHPPHVAAAPCSNPCLANSLSLNLLTVPYAAKRVHTEKAAQRAAAQRDRQIKRQLSNNTSDTAEVPRKQPKREAGFAAGAKRQLAPGSTASASLSAARSTPGQAVSDPMDESPDDEQEFLVPLFSRLASENQVPHILSCICSPSALRLH